MACGVFCLRRGRRDRINTRPRLYFGMHTDCMAEARIGLFTGFSLSCDMELEFFVYLALFDFLPGWRLIV